MRPLTEIEAEEMELENLAEYIARRMRAIQKEKRQALSQIFIENTQLTPEEEETAIKWRKAKHHVCLCSYNKKGLVINPRCGVHNK